MWVRPLGRLCLDVRAEVLWAAMRRVSVQRIYMVKDLRACIFHKYETVLSLILLWPCKWPMLIPCPVTVLTTDLGKGEGSKSDPGGFLVVSQAPAVTLLMEQHMSSQ